MTTVERGGMKDQNYAETRDAEFFEQFHLRARTIDPKVMYELVRLGFQSILPLYRIRYIGIENIPAEGACILAPNHFSFLDHFYLAWKLDRRVRFMAKSQMFIFPLYYVYSYGGVFPVRRGHHDPEAMKTAEILLDAGELLGVYIHKGRLREGTLREQKVGYSVGHLALKKACPVVPVAIMGSQGARNWKRLQVPVITVVFGKPMYLGDDPDPTRDEAISASQRVADAFCDIYESHEKDHLARWRGLCWI